MIREDKNEKSNEIQIEKISSPDQLMALLPFAIRTFRDTYLDMNPAGLVEKYIAREMYFEKWESEWMELGSAFYVLKNNEEIISYLKINLAPNQTDFNEAHSIEIERIYVDKIYKGRGYGKMLIDFVNRLAKQYEKTEIWLGVWEKNILAISFYQKMGFEKKGEHRFCMDDDQQVDWVLARNVVE